MNYLIFLFYMLVCAVGFAAVVVAGLMFVKYRKRAILYYTCVLVSLGFFVLSFLPEVFASIADFKDPVMLDRFQWLASLFDFMGYVSFCACAPFFYHYLMGIPINRFKRLIFLILLTIGTSAFIIWQVTEVKIWARGVAQPVLYGIVLYGLIFGAYHRSNIGHPVLKRAITILLLISMFFFPFFIFDSMPELAPFWIHQPPYSTLSLPVYLMIINTLGIVFAVRFFDEPAFLDQGQLTDHFLTPYNISGREAEIVTHLIMGLSNREIGEKLFISFRTVENHLYKIYQKTGVRNRVELTNLIQTNQR